MKAVMECPLHGPQMMNGTLDPSALGTPPKPAAERSWPREENKKRRGHNFYPPKSASIPPLYATDETPAADKMIAAHYFIGGTDWWIAEADEESAEAFGFACMNGDEDNAEWGYIDLRELERLRVGPLGVVVERDVNWTQKRFAEIDGVPARVIERQEM